ncbi:GNAT family N-acetyltransferase [Jeotgalibacillus marinus]|uniref:GNAT family N-acetyltransferase n=1 Tax=Jeotgalibacillus marinus TaxID=86667 RepID=A0ABV3Q0Y2_9BACL
MIIRHAEPNDAEKLVHLMEQVEKSNFMLFEPGERKIPVEAQRKRIKAINEDLTSSIFLAEDDGELAGFLFATGGNPARAKHRVYVVLGVASHFRGKGIGTKLFEHLDRWAKEQSIHRLELTVMHHNHTGIGLYKKMGFTIEGTKKHSLFVNGKYVDEYYMSKII